jgi:UDP:flavonoid glycosyltransferase YjiC (YdhE family)
MLPHFPVNVLIAPLDWGLGHATRCIPIIKALEDRGITVIVAAGGPQKILLQREFPGIEFLEIPGYGIRYTGGKGSLVWGLVFWIPGLLKSIRKENTWLEELCRQREINAIISDNRYGFYHKEKYCVFITHQLFIQSGLGNLANRILQRLNYRFIRRFSECWVPDFRGPVSLAGLLSHPSYLPGIPVKYTGPLSRFGREEKKDFSNPLLILISGPEPQRTLFENKMISELALYKGRAVVVRGLPGVKEEIKMPNTQVEIHNHLASGPLCALLRISETVICRSGYSTVMDLATLKKKAILIPTPGQPEQEYLGKYLHEKKWAVTIAQRDFNLERSLNTFKEKEYGFPRLPDALFPEGVIREFLNQLDIRRI